MSNEDPSRFHALRGNADSTLLVPEVEFMILMGYTISKVSKEVNKMNLPFHRKDSKGVETLSSQGVAVLWSFSCISCISWWK